MNENIFDTVLNYISILQKHTKELYRKDIILCMGKLYRDNFYASIIRSRTDKVLRYLCETKFIVRKNDAHKRGYYQFLKEIPYGITWEKICNRKREIDREKACRTNKS